MRHGTLAEDQAVQSAKRCAVDQIRNAVRPSWLRWRWGKSSEAPNVLDKNVVEVKGGLAASALVFVDECVESVAAAADFLALAFPTRWSGRVGERCMVV